MNQKISILIVEDDVIIGEDMKSSIETLGYRITGTATSGEAAIEKIKAEQPDFVMMDIVLRGKLNGIETAKILNEKYNVPIIFVSAYSDQMTKDRINAVSHYGHLMKPFQLEEIKMVLEHAVMKRLEEKISNGL